MKKIKLLLVLPIVLLGFLTSCNNDNNSNNEKNNTEKTNIEKTEVKIDYQQVTTFEADLNKGIDVKNKVVIITVDKLVPNSAFGYDIYAGEHLNFVSNEHPGVKEGDVITVRVTDYISMFGSYIIHYEKL